jgi:hypothetical protein
VKFHRTDLGLRLKGHRAVFDESVDAYPAGMRMPELGRPRPVIITREPYRPPERAPEPDCQRCPAAWSHGRARGRCIDDMAWPKHKVTLMRARLEGT